MTVLIEYCISIFLPDFVLAMVFLYEFLHNAAWKIYELWIRILENYPIIPELFLILFTTNYSKKIFQHNVRMPINWMPPYK